MITLMKPSRADLARSPLKLRRILYGQVILGSIVIAIQLGLTLPLAAAEEGRVILDWSNEPAGEQPDLWVQDVQVASWGGGQSERLVVNSTTTPGSPFANGQPAMFASGSAQALLQAKPFDKPPMKGWWEVDFVISNTVEDHIYLGIGNNSQSPGPRIDNNSPSEMLMMIVFVADKPPVIKALAGTELNSPAERLLGSRQSFDSGAPHKFRVDWDFTAKPAVLNFAIDGEPLVGPTGDPLQVEVDPTRAQSGLDLFRVALKAGFVGNMKVSE